MFKIALVVAFFLITAETFGQDRTEKGLEPSQRNLVWEQVWKQWLEQEPEHQDFWIKIQRRRYLRDKLREIMYAECEKQTMPNHCLDAVEHALSLE